VQAAPLCLKNLAATTGMRPKYTFELSIFDSPGYLRKILQETDGRRDCAQTNHAFGGFGEAVKKLNINAAGIDIHSI
jgi:hypothetical protein